MPSPSIPQGFTPPNVEQFQNTPSQLEPHRLPPPPPRKIPIHKEDAEGQEPTSLSTQTDESGGTSQSPGQREGSEMHTIGDNFNLLKKPVEVPPAVTAEPHNGDGYSVHGRRVDAGESDGESPTEQATRSGHAGDISYDNGNSSEGFAPPDVHRQSEERPLMTSTEPERTAPNAQDWGHITNSSNNQIQRDDSFYWHSPHSSASVSHDLDQNQDVPGMSSLLDATPEPQEKHITAPPATQEPFGTSEQTTSMYQSTIGSYGASALGFGGPSDWEHFGDYDGEEVDDTDLYIRPKSPVKSNAAADTCNTPELPGDVVPVDIQPEQHPTTVAKPRRSSTLAAVQPILSDSIATIEARSNEAHHDGFAERDLKESFDNLAQPSASDKQGPTSSSAVEQEFVAVQQSASKSIPTTFPPQFPYEREQQQPKSSKHAANGAVMDRHNTQAAILEGSEQPSPDSQSGNSSGVGATEVHSAEYAVPENESLAERTVPRSDGAAYDDVQQPLNEHFVAQSGHEDKPRLENGAPSAGCHEMSRENAAKQESVVSDGSVLPKIKELRDPYADLDPWEKASLNRYVAMLHEESQASTDAEKLNMFKAFVRKEWKLRAILYGADDDLGDDFALATKNPPVSRTNTLPLPSPVSKALPALPPDANQPEAEATQAKSQLSNKMHKPSLASLMTTKGHGPAPRTSVENSYVIVETRGGERQQHSGEDVLERYSPGGRPIPPQARNVRKPITSVGPNEHSFSPDTPRSSTSGTQVSHDKPAYTPFRYSQGYVDDAEQPVDRRTSFRPYAAMKLEPIESEPDSAPELVTGIPHHRSLPATADDRQTLISIFSSQTQSSTQRSSTDAETQSLSIADQNPPLDLRRFERADFDPLIAVLPQSGHIPSDAVELSNLQHGTNAIPDDFSFIHQQVVAWDTKAKKIRADHEKERQIRQGESEQRIDALFNDDEIGYGDISELESGFKRAEAARKTEEDRAEYQTFVEEVFNAVWKRLHYEIDQLSPLYDQYSSLAHGTLAGKDMFEATQGQYALAPMMSALLTLHQKLEIRHQKAFEAVLERDRRLKKTEVAQFYTLGNVTEVKQLEKQFESAEKKAIAEYCKQRNARANRLMDVLDQNTLRGYV